MIIECQHSFYYLTLRVTIFCNFRKEREAREEEEEESSGLRYRGSKTSKNEYEQTNSKSKTIVRRKLNNKAFVNKFIMGFFTMGMAAAAVYVFTTNPREPTEDIFMKFFQFLSYKNF